MPHERKYGSSEAFQHHLAGRPARRALRAQLAAVLTGPLHHLSHEQTADRAEREFLLDGGLAAADYLLKMTEETD